MKFDKNIFSTLTRQRYFNRVLRPFYQIDTRFLFQEQSLQISCAIAFMMSILYVGYLFPFKFLSGYGGFFEREEVLMSLSGWWSFKKTAWQFPLLKTTLLNSPQGAHIAFTNSIPLVALLLKPFKAFLSHSFHYFGAWFGIAYVLQAVSSVLLVRAFKQRSTIAIIAASSMSLMMPAFLNQLDNVALTTHGYILLGFTLYFSGFENPRRFNITTIYFTGLSFLALLTHPYLFFMVSAIYLAFLIDHALQFAHFKHFREEIERSAIALFKTILVLAFTAAVCGYFSHKIRTAGYSYYSMNLFSPFQGGKFFYRAIDATGGQHRGYNYLGLGTIFSLLFIPITQRQWMLNLFKRYRALTVILFCLFVFSISNRIFYGSTKLVHYNVIYPFSILTETLRSSGRMFWPVGYLLMLIGLTSALRFQQNKKVNVLIVLLILGLQFYDTSSQRKRLYFSTRQASRIQPSWHRLLRAVSVVNVYPGYECGVVKNRREHNKNILFFQALAARYGRSINTACVARTKPNCIVKHAIFNKPLIKGQLYVVTRSSTNLPYHVSNAMQRGWCRKTEQGIVCVANTNQRWWSNKVPPQPLARGKRHGNWFQRLRQR